MTSKEEIFASVRDLLMREFDLGRDEIRPSTHLIMDLDLDSIDAIDLAVRLEEETGYTLQEEELRSLQTVADVVELVFGKLNAAAS
jgi:acyl carrier protein